MLLNGEKPVCHMLCALCYITARLRKIKVTLVRNQQYRICIIAAEFLSDTMTYPLRAFVL